MCRDSLTEDGAKLSGAGPIGVRRIGVRRYPEASDSESDAGRWAVLIRGIVVGLGFVQEVLPQQDPRRSGPMPLSHISTDGATKSSDYPIYPTLSC